MATSTTPTTPRQQSIPGTEPDHPQVAAAIECWLEAKESSKRAAERTKAADDAITILMVASGIASYPYTDPDTGKRKWRVVDTTPRGRSVNQRSELPADAVVDEPELSESEQVEAQEARAEREASTTTHRRVPRATAEAELAAIADETRARDVSSQEIEREQSESAVDGALRPARSYYDDEEASDAPPSEPTEPSEPVEQREPNVFDFIEPYDHASPAVQPASAREGDERFDTALLASNRCALRSKTSAGHYGAGCELEVGHAGLHASEVHRWKARRPKPVEVETTARAALNTNDNAPHDAAEGAGG